MLGLQPSISGFPISQCLFQSHYVRITTTFCSRANRSFQKFQSHYVRITTPSCWRKGSGRFRFQSHYVRITTIQIIVYTFKTNSRFNRTMLGLQLYLALVVIGKHNSFQSHYVRITTLLFLKMFNKEPTSFNRTMLGLQSVDCLPQALPREFQILAIGCGKLVFACRRLYPAQITFLTIS